MREMNLNTEKQIMPDGEEVETVDSAEEVIKISISISSNNNLRVRNSVGKLPECQPRCATVAGQLATMYNIRLTDFCSFCKAQGHILTACKRKTNDGGGSGGGARGSGC